MQWLSTLESRQTLPNVGHQSLRISRLQPFLRSSPNLSNSFLFSFFSIAAQCRCDDLRAHFKNTYETARSVKGWKVKKAIKYMENVLEGRQIIPFKKFCGGVGRHAQAKEFKSTQGRWPRKSVEAVRELLINLKANAEQRKLNVDDCVINHVVVQRAVSGRRRTYRAHGRISPYLSSNCHVEFMCVQKSKDVKKADAPALRLTKKQAAVKRLAIGK